MSMLSPPFERNQDGDIRKVGVEIEFAALSARRSGEIVHELFGGQLRELSDHRFCVEATRFGDFVAELDTQFAHPEWLDERGEGERVSAWSRISASLASTIGRLSSIVVPCEIVCPPVEIGQLHALEDLVASLRASGAEGTDESVFYAFGLHLNVEIARDTSDYLSSILKAYVLLSDWLRAQIEIDVTRRMLAYTNPFPTEYVLKIIEPTYWPSMEELMNDYLDFNPTRNRELDMLPLLAHLDEQRVRRKVDDERVGKRPAFHYRLPNFELSDSATPLVDEWNRWCKVEQLAQDHAMLGDMADAYRVTQDENPAAWASRAGELLA